MNYLLNAVNTYRVPTEEAALNLRETLNNLPYGELTSFSYTVKEIKQKGEVIETYYVVKAKLVFTIEKEPESLVHPIYELGE